MNRSLSIDRLYSLGNYSNIRFLDEVNNLPGEIAFNSEVVSLIRHLQMIQLELDYRKYVELYEQLGKLSLEESTKLLEEFRTSTLRLLSKEFKNIFGEGV